MLYEILSFAQRKDQVKCYTLRDSGCMLVPEAIFFRIICHFKKVFTKLRSGSGVWGIKEKSKGVGVLQNGPSPDKHMGKLRFVQDWYRKNTVGGIHSARCDFPCNLPLDCSDPLHPGSLPRWKMQLTGRKTTLPGVISLQSASGLLWSTPPWQPPRVEIQ